MKRTISDHIPEETLHRLTEEAFETAPGAEKKPAGTARRLLALAASLALVVTAFNLDTVYAAVQELLYFLPGSGPVSQEEPLEYWLPDREYSAQVGNTQYFVTYLYRRGDTLAVGVEKEGPSLHVDKNISYRESEIGREETNAPYWIVPLTDEEKAKRLEEYKNRLLAKEREKSDSYQIFEPQENHLTDEEMLKLAAGEAPESHFEEAPAQEGQSPDQAVNLPAPAKQTPDLGIALLDEAGDPIELEHTGRNSSIVLGMEETEAREALEVEGFTYEKFTLVVDGAVRFPVELHRVDLEDYALTKSTVAEDAGYRVSLLPLNENCTRFALIPEPVGEQAERAAKGTYWSPMSFDIEAIGEDGKTYKAEAVNSRPGCQEYYLPGLPKTRIKAITLTGILESTRYEKSPAAIRLPAFQPGESQAMDQKLKLWNLEITVIAAGLREDGSLWVELRPEDREGLRFNQLDFDWPKEDRGLSLTHSFGENGGVLIEAHEMAHQAGKKTTLPVTFVSVVQEGRWEFAVPEAE